MLGVPPVVDDAGGPRGLVEMSYLLSCFGGNPVGIILLVLKVLPGVLCPIRRGDAPGCRVGPFRWTVLRLKKSII